MGVMGYDSLAMQGPTANIEKKIEERMGKDTQRLVLDFGGDADLKSCVGWLNDHPKELRLLKAALAEKYELNYNNVTDQLTVTRKSR